MLVARIAFSDATKAAERAQFIEAHKAHLRDAQIGIIQSGPFAAAGGPGGALIVAEVEDVAAFQGFSDADPFVRSGVYGMVHIVTWTVTIDRGPPGAG